MKLNEYCFPICKVFPFWPAWKICDFFTPRLPISTKDKSGIYEYCTKETSFNTCHKIHMCINYDRLVFNIEQRWAKTLNFYANIKMRIENNTITTMRYDCGICEENIMTISVQYFSNPMNLQEILHCNVWTIEAILYKFIYGCVLNDA